MRVCVCMETTEAEHTFSHTFHLQQQQRQQQQQVMVLVMLFMHKGLRPPTCTLTHFHTHILPHIYRCCISS